MTKTISIFPISITSRLAFPYQKPISSFMHSCQDFSLHQSVTKEGDKIVSNFSNHFILSRISGSQSAAKIHTARNFVGFKKVGFHRLGIISCKKVENFHFTLKRKILSEMTKTRRNSFRK